MPLPLQTAGELRPLWESGEPMSSSAAAFISPRSTRRSEPPGLCMRPLVEGDTELLSNALVTLLTTRPTVAGLDASPMRPRLTYVVAEPARPARIAVPRA